MNSLQIKAAALIEKYHDNQLTLTELRDEIVKLNPHTFTDVQYEWWLDDIKSRFAEMSMMNHKKIEYLGKGSNSLISYLETPEA